jgi:sirohydrochlorin cobaltochelatase
MRDAALLLLGHGSTINADSSAPTYQHAEEIRRRGLFAEVHVGFWKEEPNFRQSLRQSSCRTVYVVPNFISSGYFTEQVIPRELGLSGPLTRIGEQDVYYCQPVGLSPAMTDVLLARAKEVVAATSEPCDPRQTCLFICGHGTSLNDNSTKIIHDQAAIIRERGLYADCQGVLMEQSPFVKDWRTLTTCPNVIVVPFFISDGLHSYEDIPVLLGLTHNMREKGFVNPHREGARRLWYATAIGTEALIAEVILDSVARFEAEHPIASAPNTSTLDDSIGSCLEDFLAKVKAPHWSIGQLRVWNSPDGSFSVNRETSPGGSVSEGAEPSLEIASLEELRRVILTDSEGHFRPLRAAPDLRSDWSMKARDVKELRAIIDYVYPAALANWFAWRLRKTASGTPWKATAERQSGRFRIVRELDTAGLREITGQVCDKGCLKRRLWDPETQLVEEDSCTIPLVCPEACNYLVNKAREKIKGPEAEAE